MTSVCLSVCVYVFLSFFLSRGRKWMACRCLTLSLLPHIRILVPGALLFATTCLHPCTFRWKASCCAGCARCPTSASWRRRRNVTGCLSVRRTQAAGMRRTGTEVTSPPPPQNPSISGNLLCCLLTREIIQNDGEALESRSPLWASSPCMSSLKSLPGYLGLRPPLNAKQPPLNECHCHYRIQGPLLQDFFKIKQFSGNFGGKLQF